MVGRKSSPGGAARVQGPEVLLLNNYSKSTLMSVLDEPNTSTVIHSARSRRLSGPTRGVSL
jgi:hypothetical protein